MVNWKVNMDQVMHETTDFELDIKQWENDMLWTCYKTWLIKTS